MSLAASREGIVHRRVHLLLGIGRAGAEHEEEGLVEVLRRAQVLGPGAHEVTRLGRRHRLLVHGVAHRDEGVVEALVAGPTGCGVGLIDRGDHLTDLGVEPRAHQGEERLEVEVVRGEQLERPRRRGRWRRWAGRACSACAVAPGPVAGAAPDRVGSEEQAARRASEPAPARADPSSRRRPIVATGSRSGIDIGQTSLTGTGTGDDLAPARRPLGDGLEPFGPIPSRRPRSGRRRSDRGQMGAPIWKVAERSSP